jgi:hypothetical protein
VRRLGIDPGARREEIARWGNTSLTIAEGPAPWRVRLLNCTAHLEDGEARARGAATGGVA